MMGEWSALLGGGFVERFTDGHIKSSLGWICLESWQLTGGLDDNFPFWGKPFVHLFERGLIMSHWVVYDNLPFSFM